MTVSMTLSASARCSFIGCSVSFVETEAAGVCSKPSDSTTRLSTLDTVDILDALDAREVIEADNK